jgi:hypothetical protein
MNSVEQLTDPREQPEFAALFERHRRELQVQCNTYQRAGDITPGEMDFDEPTEAEIERRRQLAAG